MKCSFRTSLTHLIPIRPFFRWLPTMILMGLIFVFSSQSSETIPNFGSVDTLLKKTSHILGYSLLTVSIFYGSKWDIRKKFWIYLFVLFFAISDEFHQSFVSGRNSSWFDVFVFDHLGTIIGILLVTRTKTPTQIPVQTPHR